MVPNRSLLALPLALLAACGTGPNNPELDGPVVTVAPSDFAGGSLYVCDTGQAIRAAGGGEGIRLAIDEDVVLDLPRVESEIGPTFASDGWVWFLGSDGRAILTEQGGQTTCEPSLRAAYDAALAQRRATAGQPIVAGFNPSGATTVTPAPQDGVIANPGPPSL